jgi:protein SCO1/2
MTRRMFRQVVLLLALLTTATVAVIALAAAQGARPPAADPDAPQLAFTLADPDGRPITAADLHGRWAMIYFGYTFCPDICPTEMAHWRRVLDGLGPLAERIQPVFITVDPARDTPEVLKGYLPFFDRRIIGLTGATEAALAAARSVGATARIDDDPRGNGHYTVTHSVSTFVVDPAGRLAFRFQAADPLPEILAELRTRLR